MARVPEELETRAASDMQQAETLAAEGTAESRRAAADRFANAATLYRAAGHPRGEAEALAAEARVWRALGRADTALDRVQEALALEVDDPRFQASLLNIAGTLHSRRGDQEAAIESLRQALQALETLAAPQVESASAPMSDSVRQDLLLDARLRNSLGIAHQRLGQQQEAIDAFRQVLAVTRELGVTRGEAAALTNLANSHYQLGELAAARRSYEAVLEIRRAMGDPAGEARALSYLAWTEAAAGSHARAVERFQGALTIHRQAGDQRAEADTLAGLSASLSDLGDAEAAGERADEALKLALESGERRIAANALRTLGESWRLRGQPTEALAAYRRALEMSRQDLDRWAAADTLARIARVHRGLDALSEARAAMEEALTLIEALRRDVTREELRTSFLASRNEYYRFLIDVLMDLDAAHPEAGHAATALTVHERARARSLLDLLTEAGADIRQGVDADLLAQEAALLTEIEVAEDRLAVARQEDSIASPRVTAATDHLADLLDRYQSLLATLRAQSPRYLDLVQPEPLTAEAIRRDLLEPGSVLFEFGLGEERSHLWVVEPEAITTYALPPRAEIEADAEALHAALGERNRHLDGETPVARRQRIAEADAAVADRAARLSHHLLTPAADHLPPGRRLVVVADGALQVVPFGLLPHPSGANSKVSVAEAGSNSTLARGGSNAEASAPDRGALLLRHHEVVNLPSASVLAVLRREAARRPAPPLTLAVLADPVFGARDPRLGMGGQVSDARPPQAMLRGPDAEAYRRLRFSGREAASIAALVPGEERWVAEGFAAARSAVTSGRLADYRLVHFATHAVVDDDEPQQTGLVLSMIDADGRPTNGFLRLHDIYQLDLAADLVTLSACETAHGQEIQGEGLVGLVRGFMYAGAQRVVASQWSVEDRATAVLMEHFYRGVLERGLSPAAALRDAQLTLLDDPRWDAAYYWAPFVLQGDWR